MRRLAAKVLLLCIEVDKVLHSARLSVSVPCLYDLFQMGMPDAVETSNLLETFIGVSQGLMTEWLSGANSEPVVTK